MQAPVIPASPAPTGGSGFYNTQQVQPSPVQIWGRLSRTEDKQEREGRPEVREPGHAMQEDACPPSPSWNPKLERERGSWGRVSLCKPQRGQKLS